MAKSVTTESLLFLILLAIYGFASGMPTKVDKPILDITLILGFITLIVSFWQSYQN